MSTIRLILADDHPIVLDGLEQLFAVEPDMQVLARCRSGPETVEALRVHRPDVLVLDLRLPGLDGLGVLQQSADADCATRTVLLTAAVTDEQMVEAIRLGARGVVLKESAPELLVQAVRAVHAGGEWLEQGLVGRAIRRLLTRESGLREAIRTLTPRELEIVRLVAEGLRNRTVAERLFISEGTVKIHLHRIYEKLGIDGRFELAVYARDRGLV
ncbi:MAG TPA: response regulator transcription factor [Thermoanaerobaculia bacterium]|nr:response regulator transcription factor [Thermoanaerobaculia bacterium]